MKSMARMWIAACRGSDCRTAGLQDLGHEIQHGADDGDDLRRFGVGTWI